MNIIDWKVEDDQDNIRDGAIELRKAVSENMYFDLYSTKEKANFQVNNDRTYWRKECISKLEIMIGAPISGRVLEIGAGTAWCSSLLSQKKEVNEVYALDYDRYSVDTLMPMVAKNLDADFNKLKFVVGSYNTIKTDDNFFDFIISIGAIHHSENLTATFQECQRCLKPGGFLIAVEHCHPNSYTIEMENFDNEKLIDPKRAMKLYGDDKLKIKAKDNSDHNYRISEFEAAAFASRLNILPYIFHEKGEHADDQIFINPKPYKGFSNRVFKPYFSKSKIAPVFDNLLVICQKPNEAEPSTIFNDINLEEVSLSQKRSTFQKIYHKTMNKLKSI